jgi:hypothetical protein
MVTVRSSLLHRTVGTVGPTPSGAIPVAPNRELASSGKWRFTAAKGSASVCRWLIWWHHNDKDKIYFLLLVIYTSRRFRRRDDWKSVPLLFLDLGSPSRNNCWTITELWFSQQRRFILYSSLLVLQIKPSMSRDSSVGIATGYGLNCRGVGVRVPVGSRIFSSPPRPDRLCGPPNLLSSG